MKKRMNYNVIKPPKGAGGQAGFIMRRDLKLGDARPLVLQRAEKAGNHYDNDRAIVRFERSGLIAP